MLALLVALAAAPACENPIPDVVAGAVAHGGAFLGTIDVPGDGYDQIIAFVKRGDVVVGLASHGCIISAPIHLAPARHEVPALTRHM